MTVILIFTFFPLILFTHYSLAPGLRCRELLSLFRNDGRMLCTLPSNEELPYEPVDAAQTHLLICKWIAISQSALVALGIPSARPFSIYKPPPMVVDNATPLFDWTHETQSPSILLRMSCLPFRIQELYSS